MSSNVTLMHIQNLHDSECMSMLSLVFHLLVAPDSQSFCTQLGTLKEYTGALFFLWEHLHIVKF